ncbi:MAG: zinc ribbon domain-containing protein [Saprospiraceae bacterium]
MSAATQELTVEEKLRQLFNLQRIDSQIDEIQIMKGELPMEVSDLEDEIAGLQTRIDRLQSVVTEMESDLSKYHAQIKEAEMLIQRYQAQLDNVKNNREFEALTKELEMQRLDIQLKEKKIRAGEIELDNKRDTLKGTEDRIEKKKKELDAKKVELNQIIEKTDQEEKTLRGLSMAAREHVEERLIRAYDKVRTSYRNGLAVVTVERNSCGGCFNKIPPQLQLEIAQHRKIIACEHCGRILVDSLILGTDGE